MKIQIAAGIFSVIIMGWDRLVNTYVAFLGALRSPVGRRLSEPRGDPRIPTQTGENR